MQVLQSSILLVFLCMALLCMPLTLFVQNLQSPQQTTDQQYHHQFRKHTTQQAKRPMKTSTTVIDTPQ